VPPADNEAVLAALASEYAQGMTSIRGRRVQRLVKREFAGAAHVKIVDFGSGGRAVLGASASGAAWCATDGRGSHAAVVSWRHGSREGVETRYDLLKDSLPALETRTVPLADLPRVTAANLQALPAAAMLSKAMEALA